jgi:hypothetical protein
LPLYLSQFLKRFEEELLAIRDVIFAGEEASQLNKRPKSPTAILVGL